MSVLDKQNVLTMHNVNSNNNKQNKSFVGVWVCVRVYLTRDTKIQ